MSSPSVLLSTGDGAWLGVGTTSQMAASSLSLMASYTCRPQAVHRRPTAKRLDSHLNECPLLLKGQGIHTSTGAPASDASPLPRAWRATARGAPVTASAKLAVDAPVRCSEPHPLHHGRYGVCGLQGGDGPDGRVQVDHDQGGPGHGHLVLQTHPAGHVTWEGCGVGLR